jgi:hypothetical protein
LCGTCATGLETHIGVPFSSGQRQPLLTPLDSKRVPDDRHRSCCSQYMVVRRSGCDCPVCGQGNVSSASKRGGLGCGCEEATARWGCDAVYQSAFLDRGGGPRCATRAKTGARILRRAAKRLQPRPMASRMQHRNETAPHADRPGMPFLEHDDIHSLPVTDAYVWRPCVNPADLPLGLWLGASADLAVCFSTSTLANPRLPSPLFCDRSSLSTLWV